MNIGCARVLTLEIAGFRHLDSHVIKRTCSRSITTLYCWWVLVLASWLAAAFPALKSELHNHPG